MRFTTIYRSKYWQIKYMKNGVFWALSFFERSVLSRATRRNIPEDAIRHSHRRENLKFYKLSIV
jgi:hypothetical protein